MNGLPTLVTPRLLLRPFQRRDRYDVQRILSNPQVNATLLDIPVPFSLDHAELWIQAARDGMRQGIVFPFALVLKRDGWLLGCADIELQADHNRGDIAYWLDPAYWGQGYTSEAASRIIDWGFEQLELHRVYAQCLHSNIASAKVMQNAGLSHEAFQRQSIIKDGQFMDIDIYGLTRDMWEARRRKNPPATAI